MSTTKLYVPESRPGSISSFEIEWGFWKYGG